MTRRRRAAVLVAAGCAAVLTTGCAAREPLATAGTSPPSATLRVGLVEWQIVTSSPAVTAGVDQLTVTNTGTTSHDLHVNGPGVHAHTPLLAPGSTVTLTITTRAGGTLTMTCEVPGHEEAGMRATVAVTH